MADILDVIRAQPNINLEKLATLCSKKNVWDHFDMARTEFFELSDNKQRELTSKFYFDHFNQQHSIDESIGEIIKNSDGLSLKKVYDRASNKTEMSISTEKKDERKPKAVTMWSNDGFFQCECSNINLEKTNMPENTIFYVNQGYRTYKDGKKCYYNDIYIVAQIMPLAHQPKDIESDECKDDEVKILRALYDPKNGKFLGIEYCVTLITVREDLDEQFFDYGYTKGKSKRLYSTVKNKIPSSFRATCFGFLKNQFEGGVLSEQDFSKVFFYLPSTMDRCEEVKKYMTSVYLRPFIANIKDLGEDFNPAVSFDKAAVVSYMKKAAEQSSRNLKRNADAFLSKTKHDNETLIWPSGKRTVSDKFALTY